MCYEDRTCETCLRWDTPHDCQFRETLVLFDNPACEDYWPWHDEKGGE